VSVRGQVAEDVAAASGQANLEASGSIGEDLLFAVGQASVAGQVSGNVEGTAGSYGRTGTVGGSENVVIADAGGDEAEEQGFTDDAFDAIRHWIVVVVLGALALWLVPRAMNVSEATLRRRPLAALGSGVAGVVGFVVAIIVVVIVVVLLAIVLGLLTLGALAAIEAIGGSLVVFVASFLFTVVVAFVADALVGLAIGRLAVRGGWGWGPFAALAVGAAVVVALTSLPIVGGWLKVIVILLGLGALVLAAWSAWRSRPSTRDTATVSSPAV
jgi:hypothetical protein